MSELVTAPLVAPTVKLPPATRLPKVVQGFAFALSRRAMMRRLSRRHGEVFTLNIPVFGRAVVVGDPHLAKQIFTTSPDDLGNIQPNLSRLFGSGSVFALERDEHRRRRRLLAPPFHGKSIKNYEEIIEQETLREIANWPEGQLFPTLPSTNRITLNAILRAVFGAEGTELDELRRVIPPWVTLGSRLALFPKSERRHSRFGPWGRFDEYRRRFEVVLDKLIANERADPDFDDRTDVLALMLRSRYEDGSVMSRKDIGDELITLLAAGHETTASTLAWAFERISRHPELLAALAEEAEGDGSELRHATILEVQRARTVILFAARQVNVPNYRLGDWVIPQGDSIIVNIVGIHENPDVFADPERFDPQRYLGAKGTKPNAFSWMPFGGGARRCVGAAFADMEMDVVLRTVLRRFVIEPTTAPPEKWYSRGVAYTPKDGGRIVVHRR